MHPDGLSATARALRVEAGVAHLDRSWWSWAGPQGGLLAGLCLNAALPVLGPQLAPRSLTAHFLTPATEGELRMTTSVLRESKSSAVVSVVADPAVAATVVAGRSRGSSELAAVPAPAVPRPEDCPDLVLPVEMVPFTQHLRLRAADDNPPLSGGRSAVLTCWVRLVEQDVPLDAAVLSILCDAMPPALYGVAASPVAVPTVELNVCFADRGPGPGTGQTVDQPVTDRGWLLLRIATRTAGGGWCVDDSEVWGGDGRLLAQARQTRRVLGDWV